MRSVIVTDRSRLRSSLTPSRFLQLFHPFLTLTCSSLRSDIADAVKAAELRPSVVKHANWGLSFSQGRLGTDSLKDCRSLSNMKWQCCLGDLIMSQRTGQGGFRGPQSPTRRNLHPLHTPGHHVVVALWMLTKS